jgi:hypothetical protein
MSPPQTALYRNIQKRYAMRSGFSTLSLHPAQ